MAWRDNFNCPRYVSKQTLRLGQTGATFHHTVFFIYFCTMDFKLVSDYAPMGDQPEAIAQLVGSIRHGSKHNTLRGVTGSGKTFTVANVIAQLNRPTLVLSHNKTLAAQLYGEFRKFLPGERRGVFRLLLRLLPAGGLPPLDGHLHRKRPFDQRRDRENAPAHRGHAAVGAPRRGRRIERIVPLRRRQPGGFPCHGHQHPGRAGRQLQAFPLQAGRKRSTRAPNATWNRRRSASTATTVDIMAASANSAASASA